MLKVKKTIEIEYVGIEDVQEILDDINAVINEGHHVSFNLMPTGNTIYVDIYIMLNGFYPDKSYDFKFQFAITGNKEDVKTMHDCKTVLKNLLVED